MHLRKQVAGRGGEVRDGEREKGRPDARGETGWFPLSSDGPPRPRRGDRLVPP